MAGLIGIFLAFSLGAAALHGGQQLMEPFMETGPNGIVPFGWEATNREAVAIVPLAGKPYQRIHRGRAGGEGQGGSSAIYYTASEGAIREGAIKDVKARLIVRVGGSGAPISSLRGVIVRAQAPTLVAPTKEFWGYSIGFISHGEMRGLGIYENPTGIVLAGAGVQRAFVPFQEDLAGNVDYQLQISARGRQLMAVLASADGDKEIARVEYSDAEEVAGYFGLRAAHANTSVNTYFRDLHLETLEEGSNKD